MQINQSKQKETQSQKINNPVQVLLLSKMQLKHSHMMNQLQNQSFQTQQGDISTIDASLIYDSFHKGFTFTSSSKKGLDKNQINLTQILSETSNNCQNIIDQQHCFSSKANSYQKQNFHTPIKENKSRDLPPSSRKFYYKKKDSKEKESPSFLKESGIYNDVEIENIRELDNQQVPIKSEKKSETDSSSQKSNISLSGNINEKIELNSLVKKILSSKQIFDYQILQEQYQNEYIKFIDDQIFSSSTLLKAILQFLNSNGGVIIMSVNQKSKKFNQQIMLDEIMNEISESFTQCQPIIREEIQVQFNQILVQCPFSNKQIIQVIITVLPQPSGTFFFSPEGELFSKSISSRELTGFDLMHQVSEKLNHSYKKEMKSTKRIKKFIQQLILDVDSIKNKNDALEFVMDFQQGFIDKFI